MGEPAPQGPPAGSAGDEEPPQRTGTFYSRSVLRDYGCDAGEADGSFRLRQGAGAGRAGQLPEGVRPLAPPVEPTADSGEAAPAPAADEAEVVAPAPQPRRRSSTFWGGDIAKACGVVPPSGVDADPPVDGADADADADAAVQPSLTPLTEPAPVAAADVATSAPPPASTDVAGLLSPSADPPEPQPSPAATPLSPQPSHRKPKRRSFQESVPPLTAAALLDADGAGGASSSAAVAEEFPTGAHVKLLSTGELGRVTGTARGRVGVEKMLTGEVVGALAKDVVCIAPGGAAFDVKSPLSVCSMRSVVSLWSPAEQETYYRSLTAAIQRDFPVGSRVKLANGEYGIVTGTVRGRAEESSLASGNSPLSGCGAAAVTPYLVRRATKQLADLQAEEVDSIDDDDDDDDPSAAAAARDFPVGAAVRIVASGAHGFVTGTARGRVGVETSDGVVGHLPRGLVRIDADDAPAPDADANVDDTLCHDDSQWADAMAACAARDFPVGTRVEIVSTGEAGCVTGTARGRVGVCRDRDGETVGALLGDVRTLEMDGDVCEMSPEEVAREFPVGATVRVVSTGARGTVTGTARGRVGVETSGGVIGVMAVDVVRVDIDPADFGDDEAEDELLHDDSQWADAMAACAARDFPVGTRVEIVSTGEAGCVTGTARGRVGVCRDRDGETVGALLGDVRTLQRESGAGEMSPEKVAAEFPVGATVRVVSTGARGTVTGTARGRVGVGTGGGVIGVMAADVVRVGGEDEEEAEAYADAEWEGALDGGRVFAVGSSVEVVATGATGCVWAVGRGRVGIRMDRGGDLRTVGVHEVRPVELALSEAHTPPAASPLAGSFPPGALVRILSSGGVGHVVTASPECVLVGTEQGVVGASPIDVVQTFPTPPAGSPPGGSGRPCPPAGDSPAPWDADKDAAQRPQRTYRTLSAATEKSDVTEPGRRAGRRQRLAPAPPEGNREKKRTRRERELLALERKLQSVHEERAAKVWEVEEAERRRAVERSERRERARVQREQILKEPTMGHGKHLERRILENYDRKVQKIQEEERRIIEERRALFDKLSTKNPEWRVRLDQHEQDVLAAQRRHREEHQREIKAAMRSKQQETPTFAYSPTLELARKEQAEREASEAAKQGEAFIKHLRKQKYGALVNDLYAKPPTRPRDPRDDASTGLTPQLPPIKPGRPPPARSERNRLGVEYMKEASKQAVRRPGERRVSTRAPPANVAVYKQGTEYMREAGARVREQRAAGSRQQGPSPESARRDLIALSKRHYAGSGAGWDNDDALRELAAKGVVTERAAAALGTLHANSDALIEALNLKLRILESL